MRSLSPRDMDAAAGGAGETDSSECALGEVLVRQHPAAKAATGGGCGAQAVSQSGRAEE